MRQLIAQTIRPRPTGTVESMIVSLFSVTSSSQWQPPAGMSEAVGPLHAHRYTTSGETLLMSYGPQAMAGDTGVKTAVVVRHDSAAAVSQTIALRQRCVSDRCTPRQADGWTCTADRQCQSGACVDNHCCGGACSGDYEGCGSSRAGATRPPQHDGDRRRVGWLVGAGTRECWRTRGLRSCRRPVEYR